MALVLAGMLPGPLDGQTKEEPQERLPRVNPAEVGFAVRHWTVADGLPSQQITSLAQTPDGYLWCGTDDALLRYDGSRFRVFFGNEVPELEGLGISALSCDRDGRLWIWDSRSALVSLEAGRFSRIGESHGWEGKWIRPVLAGEGNDCWLVGGAGEEFHCFRDGRFTPFSHPSFPGPATTGGGPKDRLGKVWVDADGPRWAIMNAPLKPPAPGEGGRDRERRLVRITEGGIEDVEVSGRGPQF